MATSTQSTSVDPAAAVLMTEAGRPAAMGDEEPVSLPSGGLLARLSRKKRVLAPAPIIDKYPIVIGQNLSLTYLSSVYRLCSTGIRYQYVDALNELLEHDPHSRGVIRQRVLSLAGARVELTPAKLPKGDKDEDLAKQIADECQRQVDNIPARSQAFGQLAWGIVYGVSGVENEWERMPNAGIQWEIRRLHFLHSRRLNYPNPMTWDVHVWDQGAIGANMIGPTQGPYGLRCADFPGKFVIHTPALNGDYPTRDGEGRYIGFYLALKRMIVRATAMDFERTIRPWVVAYFNRELDDGSKDPIADDADIAQANAAVKQLGNGSLNGAVLPNSVKIEILRAASQLNAKQFVEWLDEQVTKSALGQTFTTQPGAHGNRSAAQTAKEGSAEIFRYDAGCFADTLERDLIYWIVCLNWGPLVAKRLTPKCTAHVEEKPDPKVVAEVAKTLTQQDVALDADDLAERCGYKVVPKPPGDDTPRRTRMVGPGQAPEPTPEEEPTGPDDGKETDHGAAAPPGGDMPPDDGVNDQEGSSRGDDVA